MDTRPSMVMRVLVPMYCTPYCTALCMTQPTPTLSAVALWQRCGGEPLKQKHLAFAVSRSLSGVDWENKRFGFEVLL